MAVLAAVLAVASLVTESSQRVASSNNDDSFNDVLSSAGVVCPMIFKNDNVSNEIDLELVEYALIAGKARGIPELTAPFVRKRQTYQIPLWKDGQRFGGSFKKDDKGQLNLALFSSRTRL